MQGAAIALMGLVLAELRSAALLAMVLGCMR